ncbi:uncharacterized protein LOC135262129 isoform X3 [Anguilla rostrata]|uniref:uncharacterized protein LOC135262129 isoform X3 n=1 Tax=Anguilla rostrata TaxID=7938 RepID=UPI0030CDA883
MIFLRLFCIFATVQGEIHDLHYIYTALSKPISQPGIYQFTAMGIMNDRPIDFYNSEDKVKKPLQTWMEEHNEKDYWVKGTQSRRSKEQWFDVNIKILMERMHQNKSDVHILQWMHGCQVEKTTDGKLKFLKGFNQYGYDGEDFLSFDSKNMTWVAHVPAAKSTKKKWDDEPILSQHIKEYLETDCVHWLEKLLKYQELDFKTFSPPEVHLFSKKSTSPDNCTLVCLATGFYPKDVTVDILKDGVPLAESDGVASSGVRPNGEHKETYQLRKWLEIKASDTSQYSCRIHHRTLKIPIEEFWEVNPETKRSKDSVESGDSGKGSATSDGSKEVAKPLIVNEIHNLHYIYTALSKPISQPGVYQFTAMGILNDRPIDIYNSEDRVKKPLEKWMEEHNEKDYWEKGTQTRRTKEQWFDVNIKILMERMHQNKSDPDVHILQWMHGCQVEKTTDGKLKFHNGFDQYGYDGEDFLSFDSENMAWVAHVPAAESTKQKLDNVFSQDTKEYLETVCVHLLEELVKLQTFSPPEVHLFSNKSTSPDYRTLVCLATGFYPKDVTVDILKDGVPLAESDGVASSGVRPNGDLKATYQLRKWLEIQASDTSKYSCRIHHRTLRGLIEKSWDGKCRNCDCATGAIVGVVVVLLIVLVAVLVGLCVWHKKMKDKKGGTSAHTHIFNIAFLYILIFFYI